MSQYFIPNGTFKYFRSILLINSYIYVFAIFNPDDIVENIYF